ncbi:MAG: twin transmembrane helix small protein [Gammaproteobacteria bacterium]|nr:twin transmembrane helix small protein [Gammaproteobacteria bacterium]
MTILNSIIVLALLATVISLGMGLSSMAHGGDYDNEHSEQFMLARIGMQGLTLFLLLLAAIIAYLT